MGIGAASKREADLRPIPPQPKHLFAGSREDRWRRLFYMEGEAEVPKRKHLTESHTGSSPGSQT